MSVNIVSMAVLAVAISTVSVRAQGLQGPAELPPPSFKGQQYVDSRGCVFLRAGYGGQVTWVPRVSRDRKQLCGYPPSGGQVDTVEEAPAEAPAKAPTVVVTKAPDVAPAAEAPAVKTVAAEPVVTETADAGTDAAKVAEKPVVKTAEAKPAAAPKVMPPAEVVRPVTPTEMAATDTAVSVVEAGPSSGSGYRLACPKDAPVAERFKVRGGGTKVMCTTGDGSLVGATLPILVAGDLSGHKIGYAAYAEGTPTSKARSVEVVYQDDALGKSSKSATVPVPPKGYKLAWKDDRLNPNRGKQTVDGVLAQDEIWTRTVPAELRADSKVKRKKIKIIVRSADGSQTAHDGYVVSTKGGKKVVAFADPSEAPVAKSTKTEPTSEGGSGRLMVQVGSFGVASNADGAAGKLRALGLPVARGKAAGKGGAPLQVIYAGPFASAADAKAALAAARRVGFGDAIIVQ